VNNRFSTLLLLLIFVTFFLSQKVVSQEKMIDWYKEGKTLYKKQNYNAAIEAFKKANQLAKKSNDTLYIMNSISRIGLCYLAIEKYEFSELFFKKSLRLEMLNGDSIRIAKGYNNVGITKYYLSELDSCLFYYRKALEIYRAKKSRVLPQFIKNIGLVYRKKSNYEEASNYLFESAKIFETQNNQKESASIYSTLGNMYNELGYDSLSIHYHKLGLNIRKNFNNKLAYAQSLNNLANVIKRSVSKDSALSMYKSSLLITKDYNSKRLESALLNNIGEIYLDWGEIEKSKFYLNQSLDLKKNLGDKYGISHTLQNLSRVAFEEKEIVKSEKFILEGLSIAEEIGAGEIILKYYGLYSQLLTEDKRFEKATNYYGRYLKLKDSLLNYYKLKAFSEAEVKYRTDNLEKQVAFLKPLEKEIQLLNVKSENQESKIKLQRGVTLAISIGAFLLLILFLLIWRIGKQRKKINNLLEIKNEEITHRVKNNLEILTGIFIGQSRTAKNHEVKSILLQNQHRIKTISHLHNTLSREPESDVSIKIYFEGLIDDLLFSFNFPKKNCLLYFDDITLKADTILHLGLLINELITNAIKHGLKDITNPRLELTLKKIKSSIELQVKDNGLGIDSLNIKEKESYGMSLINKLVKHQLKGSITYRYDKGAIFNIQIPI